MSTASYLQPCSASDKPPLFGGGEIVRLPNVVFEPPDELRARWAKLIGPMKQRVAADLSRR